MNCSRANCLGPNNKVVYRVYAPKNRITPSGVMCGIWKHPADITASGSWSSSNCKVKTEEKTFVECECNHMSEYAVFAESDDRTGYTIYFQAACFFLTVSRE